MTHNYDPRQPRPNPEVEELLRVIDKSWKEIKEETNFTARRGLVRVLIALLEQLEDEPAQIPADIEPGAASDDACWIPPTVFSEGAPQFVEELPFNVSGPDRGRFFFYTSTGMLSRLYPGPAVDPYHVGALRSHGPWVYTLEKRYVSFGETRMHFTSMEAIERAASTQKPGDRPREGERYFLICDPRGVAGARSAPLIDVFVDLERAVKQADKLTAMLEIRFLVAALRYEFCTR